MEIFIALYLAINTRRQLSIFKYMKDIIKEKKEKKVF